MSDVPTAPERELHEQTVSRLNNLAALTEGGFEPYPYRYPKTHHAADLRSAHPDFTAGDSWEGERYALAGRLMSLREQGKVAFANLQDESGSVQLFFRKNDLENYALLRHLDLGDLIGVEGFPFVTRTGQLTLHVRSWQPLVKSLHPLPSKFHGLQDEELRARRRYLDLIVNPEAREVFRTRSRAISHIRRFLDERGFLEVEGPTLQTVAGGTEARPFSTHHNALDHDFALRISLELYLKRLLVGGFEKVYEIGRNYRNEGVDRTHNPEFTMLEFYWAYADYGDMMALVEELLSGLVLAVKGSSELSYGGQTISFARPFGRLDFVGALKERAGLDFDPTDLAALRAWTDAQHPELRRVPDYKLLDKLFGEYVEHTLVNPTFVVDVPLAISPLVKGHRSRPGLAERADLFVGGFELAPIYSELNDARDQRARFQAQTQRREAGDDEAHAQDEDFLTALEYGMPPAAGMGMGMDRLAMLLTDRQSIRDVLLFPLLRPEKPGQPAPTDQSGSAEL